MFNEYDEYPHTRAVTCTDQFFWFLFLCPQYYLCCMFRGKKAKELVGSVQQKTVGLMKDTSCKLVCNLLISLLGFCYHINICIYKGINTNTYTYIWPTSARFAVLLMRLAAFKTGL